MITKSCGRNANWLNVAIHGLKEYLDHPNRQLLDVLHEMPRILRFLGFQLNELPDVSTLCGCKQQLRMLSWRTLLWNSATCHDLGEVQAIDATGVDRIAASQHYANRTNYTLRVINTTILIDCTTDIILEIHCSMKQSQGSQIGWQLPMRNLNKFSIVTADKVYDWDLLRYGLEAEDVKPVIKYLYLVRKVLLRMFRSTIQHTNNAQMSNQCFSRFGNAAAVHFGIKSS